MNGYHPRPIMERPFGSYPPSATMNPPFIRSTPPFSFRTPGPPPFDPYTANGQSYTTMPIPIQDSQRQEGPPFGETNVKHNPLTVGSQSVRPDIVASIQKGFFQVDGKWTCYRRNYFTVACSFNFGARNSETQLYLQRGHEKHMEPIQHFAMSISAKTAAANNQESETRGLVQHTPKRNKESESVPTRHVVVPSTSQHPHHPNGAMTLAGSMYPPSHAHSAYYPTYSDPPSQSAPSSYTFERIQFQKATANNGKRRAQQQYFHVVVELYASVSRKHGDEWILIATKESDPMVVRGRSPGHYKDNNRRDSQTSMDPDRGTGPGSDGSSGGHHYGSSYPGSMDWQQQGHHTNHHNHGHNRYNDGGYRHCMHSDDSPPSAASSKTLTGSPNDLDFALSDADTLKSSDVYSLDRSRLTTPPSEADDAFFSLGRVSLSRKRPLEEDSADEEPSFACSQPLPYSISNHTFDIAPIAQSKILCAS